MAPQLNGTRAKARHITSHRPAAPQANGTRAKGGKGTSGRAPQQRPNGTRAKAAARKGDNSRLYRLPQLPQVVPNNLIGQTICLPNGQTIRVMGFDTLVPENKDTYAGAISYGCAADATFMARRLKPAGKSRSWVPPWEDIIGEGDRHVNGQAAMAEAYLSSRRSIKPVKKSARLVAQGINRLAGKTVVDPSRFARGIARGASNTVRKITPARVVGFARRLVKLAPVGMGLTALNILVEINHNEVDIHTYLNGGMLVLSGVLLVGGATISAPLVAVAGAVIVLYGVVDYVSGTGDWWDKNYGRKRTRK